MNTVHKRLMKDNIAENLSGGHLVLQKKIPEHLLHFYFTELLTT